jgi:hypothetical protein
MMKTLLLATVAVTVCGINAAQALYPDQEAALRKAWEQEMQNRGGCGAIDYYRQIMDGFKKHPILPGQADPHDPEFVHQLLFKSKELCNSEKIVQAQRDLNLAKDSTPKIAAQDAEIKRIHEETFAVNEQNKKEHAERAREQARLDQEQVAIAAESQKDLDSALAQARVAKGERDRLNATINQKQGDLRILQAEAEEFSHVSTVEHDMLEKWTVEWADTMKGATNNIKRADVLMYGDTVGVMGLTKMYVKLHGACEAAINMGREAFNADKDVQLDILPKIIVKTKECNENMKSFIAQYK